MCDKHPMPNEWHSDMIPDTAWTHSGGLIWSDQFAGWQCAGSEYYYEQHCLYYCQLSVTNPDWQLLRSGDYRTMLSLPGPVLAGMVPSPGPYTARLELSHYSSTGQRRQTHFITSNIILNARYRGAEDVSCRIQFIWKSLLHNGVYSAWLCSCHPCIYPHRITNQKDCT